MNTNSLPAHKPVLLQEVLSLLEITPGKRYIDATVGGGGHLLAILKLGGEVLGLDQDPQSIAVAKRRLNACPGGYRTAPSPGPNTPIHSKGKYHPAPAPGKYRLVHANFSKIEDIAFENGFSQVDGVLFDLGFASFQVEDESRGLSFIKDGPLDMRLDPRLGVTAADLVNSLSEKQLAQLFFEYGEEPRGRQIARKIVERRKEKLFETTTELADLVENTKRKTFAVHRSPYAVSHIHPATKVFQALRIAVNTEFENLEEGLKGALKVVKSGRRLAVISFHSGEDRIVKDTFREWEEEGKVKVITKKPVVPTDEEIKNNPRSRSAKLRVVERTYD